MSVMALAIWGQQNRALMRRHVDRTPRWWIECSDWKTTSLDWMGTSGRNTPVDTSPSKKAPPTTCDVNCRLPEFSISATSGQDCCCAAIAKKSTSCATAIAAKTGHSWAVNPSFSQSSVMAVKEVGGGAVLAVCRLVAPVTPVAQGVRGYIFLSWHVPDVRHKFGNERQISLLAGQLGGHDAEQGGDQWFVVCEKAKTSPLR
jgi:hypothetical protein